MNLVVGILYIQISVSHAKCYLLVRVVAVDVCIGSDFATDAGYILVYLEPAFQNRSFVLFAVLENQQSVVAT